MDIKQIRTFITLAKEKNYIKTSEVLNYAPSTLAKHIHSLEDEFNETFVEYVDGEIKLTNSGLIFLDYAKKIIDTYNECQGEFKQSRKENILRVAGGELMVGFSFGDFFMHYPEKDNMENVEVNTVCCSKVPNWLFDDECDIGYVQMVDMGENGGAKVTPLFQEKLCVMASANHPLAKMDAVCTADFSGFSFTYTYSECCFTEKFRNDLKEAGIELKSELFLGSLIAVINSCLSENRLCLIPYVALEKVKEYGLVVVPWIDSFNIYDCILTKEAITKEDKLYPLIEASKLYSTKLKDNNLTDKIVLL